MDVTPDSVRELLDSEDYGKRIHAVNQMRYLEPAISFELLMRASTDGNARVRYAAVSQLSSVGDQNREAASALLRQCLLTDAEMDVRAAAADSISAMKLTELFDDLREVYTQTNDWIIQMSIVASLGELGDPRGFDLLAQALQSDNDLIKTSAIGALGELGDRRAIDLLRPFATSSDWQMRYRVVQALNRLGGDEAIAILQDLTSDDVEHIAQEAQDGVQG